MKSYSKFEEYVADSFNQFGFFMKRDFRSGASDLNKSDLSGERVQLAKDLFLFIECKEHTTPKFTTWAKECLRKVGLYEDWCIIYKKPKDRNDQTMIYTSLENFLYALDSAKQNSKNGKK